MATCKACNGSGVEVDHKQPRPVTGPCPRCCGSGAVPDGAPPPACGIKGCDRPAADVTKHGFPVCALHGTEFTVRPLDTPGTPAQIRAEHGLPEPVDLDRDVLLRAADRAAELAEADAPLVVGGGGVTEPPVAGYVRPDGSFTGRVNDLLGVELTDEQVRVVEMAAPTRRT